MTNGEAQNPKDEQKQLGIQAFGIRLVRGAWNSGVGAERL